ncbi:hypothetical protein SAMD00019534_117090 [Acytostelium subglobosum LB1]|uniref:hypothetical protein n=1 Tax=Acytostelium subglobosum LB1 TaxID=1410327 RepID=UPI0006449302|nr:hypothetical protein SAMD00019534_117090 [Acytostelium subglobosum LB1]GAM28533.1 hypothetical protein SAMD00019534_117090 [Acytostelium subglobosum LB1]|eukprot:XP_012748572.1 hypothetical protein SAMD00019534_117090 [Acytostelium subglobosum LB1]
MSKMSLPTTSTAFNNVIDETCLMLYGIVSRLDSKQQQQHVQIAKRTLGQYKASATLSIDIKNKTIGWSKESPSSDVCQIYHDPINQAFKYLMAKNGLEHINAAGVLNINVEFFEGHCYMASYFNGHGVIDQSIVDVSGGSPVLTSLLLTFIIHCVLAKNSQPHREALHSTLSYLQRLHHDDNTSFNNLIDHLKSESNPIDANQLFATLVMDTIELNAEFNDELKQAGLASYVTSQQLENALFEQGAGAEGSSAATREQLVQLINRRDSRVSCYLSQCLFDLPYNRQDLRQALAIDDTKYRREACYQVIRKFDQRVESANAVRVSNQVRETWLSDTDSFSPTIVVGRESRAFSNQATLFASSNYIRIDDSIRELIVALIKCSSDEHVRQCFAKLKPPQWATTEIQQVCDKLLKLTEHLQPVIGRFRALVSSVNDNLTSATQFQGALQHLREVLTIVSTKSVAVIEDTQKVNLSRRAEGVHRMVDTSSSMHKVFRDLHAVVDDLYGRARSSIWTNLYDLEERLHSMPAVPSSFSILLQRPSVSGSERFRTNELEPKLEQEEVLQKLVRIGGSNLYMSPSNDWVEQATDIIEAIPLFIYERTIEEDGKHTTVFEVDQEGLEQTIRALAEQWSKNIQLTILSEHVALARDLLVCSDSKLQQNVDKLMKSDHVTRHTAICLTLAPHVDQIVRVTAHIEAVYDKMAEKVEDTVEMNWKQSNFITRIEALKMLLLGDMLTNTDKVVEESKRIVTQAMSCEPVDKKHHDRISFMALKKQRQMPAFHLLTTEAPGLVEGFIQAVLEEEMTLKNIVEYYKLVSEVRERINQYNREFAIIGRKVIEEFSYQPILDQYQTQMSLDENRAILRVLGDHVVIQRQVALLSVLYECDRLSASSSWSLEEAVKKEPNQVLGVMAANDSTHLSGAAYEFIFVQNRNDAEFQRLDFARDRAQIESIIKQSSVYRQEFENYVKCESRRIALEQLDCERPDLALQQRANKYHRSRTAMASTTARREVVAKHHLHDQMSNPRFAYSCGVMFPSPSSATGEIRPSGSRKRYHFVYGPSRVNLGKDERKSVEIWPQFVGVTDPLCARHARAFYQLMNYNPIVRTTTAAENLKVSENQWTALVRSIRNVQALFVERLGVGDIEDLAYQFNQRGGLAVAAHKEAEGYMSGPTAGYCIPKDLLFKLFVVTHQDSRFASAGEWERWAADQFLSEQALQKRFHSQQSMSNVREYFSQYIELSGGVILLHIAKLAQILGSVGVPSPLVSWGRDLHAALWSAWAEKKITLGGEQVNRSVVFPMTREIPESGKLAIKLNPKAALPEEESLRVHLFGVYKGDDDQKPPPDVRFAWVMRAFLILSGHYREVALSLDEEGQLIARLSWVGFLPHSSEPEDIKIRRYLATHFLSLDDFDNNNQQHSDMITRLQQLFPPHTTVGDITITAVPGVDSEDLLGFSAETLTLLGDEASYAQELLRSRGISVDQMKANAQLHRRFIDEWIPLSNLPKNEQLALKREIGGRIHPLSLRLRGPGDNFLRDLQGQDIVVFSITHPQLLAMNPATLRDLMLIGRPNSSLVAHDHVSQGRHRCWFERDVMLWYAACRGIDEQGNRITNWKDRSTRGRRSVYKAFGWGTDQYQPILGTDLREEVARQESRAIQAYEYLEKIANLTQQQLDDKTELAKLVHEINTRLFGVGLVAVSKSAPPSLHSSQLQNEIDILVQYEQRVLLANRYRRRDVVIRESLESLRDAPHAGSLSPLAFLAIGGYLILNGSPSRSINRSLTTIQRAFNRINGVAHIDIIQFESNERFTSMLTPQLATAKLQLKDRKGKMFSVKASEEHVETAVTRRKELETQSKRNAVLKFRENGFSSLGALHDQLKSTQMRDVTIDYMYTTLLTPIHDNLNKLASSLLEETFNMSTIERSNLTLGSTYNLCAKALLLLVNRYNPPNVDRLRTLIAQMAGQAAGREIDLRSWDELVGSYEEFGALNQLYECAHKVDPANWIRVTSITTEIMAVLLLLEKAAPYLSTSTEDIAEASVWRSLAEFFAKTIDDHYSEYTPWCLDPKRYPLFGRYFDDIGIMRADSREQQYQLYWQSHRALYRFIRALITTKTNSIQKQLGNDKTLFDLFVGDVKIASSGVDMDSVIVQPIGAGNGNNQRSFEQLWRVYNQLREVAFIKNDGFQTPVVFDRLDANDNKGLDVKSRVNHAFLSPIGRTHYSRAMMEGPTLGDNLFITRDGLMQTHNDRSFLTIDNAVFWCSEPQLRHYLAAAKGLSADKVQSFIAELAANKQLHAKGVLVAARFTSPIIVGSVVTLHHHHLESALSNAGYPSTDKSPFLYEMTYNKSLYPLIFNPSDKTQVLLPQEIDWLQIETTQIINQTQDSEQAKQQTLDKIRARLIPFVKEHPIIIVKGAAESGARNLSRFDLLSSSGASTGTDLDETALDKASQFIYHVSKAQNVVIQRAIICSPLYWMSPSAIDRMVERQIADHGVAVELNRHPKDTVYGTLRVIMSTSVPKSGDLTNHENWSASHPIALNSLQIATNVGRQGSLEILTPQMISPHLQSIFISKLEDAGRRVMSAIAQFGPKYWSEKVELYGHTMNSYHERFPHIKEKDATGTPIWWPRYLMLDFIPEPIWVRKGTNERLKPTARLLDIVPYHQSTKQAVFTFKDDVDGQEFEAEIVDMQFWQLEPNVGIGLWPNYWKREMENQVQVAKNNNTSSIDWSQVGVSDRIVMGNFLNVGQLFLDTLPKDSWTILHHGGGKDDTSHPPIPAQSHQQQHQQHVHHNTSTKDITDSLIADPNLSGLKDTPPKYLEEGLRVLSAKDSSKSNSKETLKRLVEHSLDRQLSNQMTPDLEILDSIDDDALSKIFSTDHQHVTCAIIVGKTTLMFNHLYPFFHSLQSTSNVPINLIGLHYSWIDKSDNRLRLNRCVAMSRDTRGSDGTVFIEFPLTPEQSDRHVNIATCYLLELPNQEMNQETEFHHKLDSELRQDGIHVLNDYLGSNERCDDKYWLRSKMTNSGLCSLSGVMVLPTVSLPADLCVTKEDIRLHAQSIIQQSDHSCGIIVQPQSNTTESEHVTYFTTDQLDQCFQQAIELFDIGYDHVMLTPFVKSIKTKSDGVSFIVRLNASIGGLTTIAIVKAGSPNETIISPGIRKSRFVRVSSILQDLPKPITTSHWRQWSSIAQDILEETGLPIVGIDMILTCDLTPFIVEVNARPGSLIFSEELQFDQNGQLTGSTMATPVSKGFWYNVCRNSSLSISNLSHLLTNKLFVSQLFQSRYSLEDRVLMDRQHTMVELLQHAMANGFVKENPCVVAASNGRDRVFMGHSDLKGLGGFTINATTQSEILCVAQLISDVSTSGSVILYNVNAQTFPNASFTIDHIIQQLSGNVQGQGQGQGQPIPTLWSTKQWDSYIKSTLAYILSTNNVDKYPSYVVQDLQGLKDQRKSIVAIFSANGELGLPHSGGVSSSSALTGAFALSLDKMFNWKLSLEQLAEMDFGEYYLGKAAGASDKTAQLFAKKGQISVVGSFPERFIKTLHFPKEIVVMMAESPIPRLSTQSARSWIIDRIADGYIKGSTTTADQVTQWAHSIMKSFCATSFVEAIAMLNQRIFFAKEETMRVTGLDQRQINAITKCLSPNLDNNTPPLLRELAAGGLIETELPELKDNIYNRYILTYRLLKALPEQSDVGGVTLWLRKSVLYALSEIERGIEYKRIIGRWVTYEEKANEETTRELMRIVKAAHDGDKQTVDYRNNFETTPWGVLEQHSCSDQQLDKYIQFLTNNIDSAHKDCNLAHVPGGFQRSLPEIDQLADSIYQQFKGLAALRVAAAGLGGSFAELIQVHQVVSCFLNWMDGGTHTYNI